jgi:PRC-barrel domain
MNLRSRLTTGVATAVLIGGLGLALPATAAETMAAPSAKPTEMTPLTNVQDQQVLVGAKVQDNKGEAVGEVESVKVGPDGKVASVNVSVGEKTIALKADSLTYAQADNTLTSKQSKADIQKMPSM